MELAALASHIRDRFGIDVQVLSPVEVTLEQVSLERRQVIAEELIALMRRSHPAVDRDPGALMIGITEHDMYLRSTPQWGFGFSLRAEDRFAVVSAARMNPVNLGDPPDLALLQTRLRKMVLKDIGVLYFGMEMSSDPGSVLYNNILGVDDLDAMGEDF